MTHSQYLSLGESHLTCPVATVTGRLLCCAAQPWDSEGLGV